MANPQKLSTRYGIFYVFRAADSDVDVGDAKWVTECAHGSLLGSDTKAQAIASARYPDFCAECMGEEND